jgi:hypothetical protein
VWSFGRRGQEQHDREEGDKEVEQLKSNLKKRETKRKNNYKTRLSSIRAPPNQQWW